MATAAETQGVIRSLIPARIDRLPWSPFHTRMVIALGVAWILDGLEITVASAVADTLTQPETLGLSSAAVGLIATVYLAGEVVGALFFGRLSDKLGRRNLFMITLGVYLVGSGLTAFTLGNSAGWIVYLYITRFIAGMGIGGEYAAINSAIDELIPARVRGRVDLVINGTYWLGSAAGAGGALVLLDTANFPANIGWRLAFGVGALFGIFVLLVRRNIPESPRWLFIHGHNQEAERIVGEIEADVERETGQPLPQPQGKPLKIRQRETISFVEIARVAFMLYPRRAVLGLALFIGQAFLYNGVTFNLGTLLSGFYGIDAGKVPQFYILWALSNFFGPLVLGRLFDTVGRKPMIALSYIGSAVVAVALAVLFVNQIGGVWTFIGVLAATFFLASAGASAAYLTVSEIFPMETRALAIAFFYAVGTAIGGISGPLLFGQLIESGERSQVMWSFLIGAAVMAVAGLVELWLGVAAEQRPLEELALPLTVADAEREDESE